MQPEHLPKVAFVVVDHCGNPQFSGDTYERAAERATALMRGMCNESPGPLYRIVQVEAE